ncbi:MAG: hypothetical protein GY870_20110, partial [archaeon]|nr:hypothetical protein [archaeon]
INNNALLVMGGINEFGLSFDTNVLGWSNINDDPDKLDYNSWFEIEMLRVCKTINEVISWISNKNLIGLTVRQTHIADKTGDAVVLALDSNGELNISRISGNYLLATNWNLAKNTIADIQAGCWRYNRSDLLLSTIASKDDVDINFCRDVLNASHQPKDSKVNNNLLFGGSGIHTLYSNINDLTNMMMYIYSFSDFNRQGILNLTEEFAKGPHSISLEALVSQQHQPSPMATIINLMAYLVTGITIIGLSLLVIYELKIKDNNNIKNRNLTKETEKKSDGN